MIFTVGGGGVTLDVVDGRLRGAANREEEWNIGDGLRARGDGEGEDGPRLDVETEGKMFVIAPRIRAKERDVAVAVKGRLQPD